MECVYAEIKMHVKNEHFTLVKQSWIAAWPTLSILKSKVTPPDCATVQGENQKPFQILKMIYCLWVAKLRQNLKLLPQCVNMELRFKKHHTKKCQESQNNSIVIMHLGRKVRASPCPKGMAQKKPESKA